MLKKVKILVIAGPTASGKSDLAVKLSLENNGEVISADSRQVYRGLDIGSGKITHNEMQNIKHYCLDIVEPMSDFSVFDWIHQAESAIQEIHSKNKLPIICGGTGMYIDALIYGLPNNPGADTEFREKIKNVSTEELLKILKEKDDEYYNKIDKHNRRRIERALEILETKNKIEERKREAKYEVEYIVLNPDREELKEKIRLRLEKRLEGEALINEVKNLLAIGVNPDWLIGLGLEYKYVTEYILNQISYEEMKELIINKSYQYAKRQMTWNKKYTK